jgi:hypothetical protein
MSCEPSPNALMKRANRPPLDEGFGSVACAGVCWARASITIKLA